MATNVQDLKLDVRTLSPEHGKQVKKGTRNVGPTESKHFGV
jgi:hypothetical protein